MTDLQYRDQLRAYLERRMGGIIDRDELPMFILQQHHADNLRFNLRFDVAAPA